MPRPYGSDRIEVLPEGRMGLLCREPKGWEPRRKAPPSVRRVDHPGTAVVWDDAHWEVLEAQQRADGSLRYVLAPWDDQNIFRGMVEYGEATELARAERKVAERKARGQRTLLVVLAPLAGILPEEDQVALEYRLGVPAARMTFLSAVPLLMFGTFCIVDLFASALGGGSGVRPDLPIGVLLLGDYLFAESFARLIVVMSQGRALGSLLSLPWLAFKAAEALRAPEAPPLAVPDAKALEAERARTFHALQPILGFLPAADQLRLRERHGFDYLSWGKTTARVLLAIGLLFALAAVVNLLAGKTDPGELLWLAAGVLLVLEQRGRFAELRAGRPAGSFLGRLLRRAALPLIAP